MQPTSAVVRGCCQTSVAQTGTHHRFRRRTQLQLASFYAHQFPLSYKASFPPGGSGERAAVTLTRVAGYRRSLGEDNDAQLSPQTRTLRIRQVHGFDFSIECSTLPLLAVEILPWS